MKYLSSVKICLFSLALLSACNTESDQYKTWRVYKADAESSSYSALDQINLGNVKSLSVAWTFRPGDAQEGARYGKYECNPIVIGSVMYATSARHWLYAIDAATGEKIWSFDPFDGEKGGGVSRGVTYWEEGADRRILFTADNHLFAVEAATGTPIPSFGIDGKINLNIESFTGSEAWVIPTSPGIIYNDLLILGSEVSEVYGAAPGYIRAYNVKTGALEWTFHTIPHPGEPGYDTWPADAWKYVGGANNWGGMSLDKKRGMVFVPLGSPTYDYYGADRKGMNLFGNSVVALNAATGEYIWHFQTVHHDLWDYDLPAPPNLVTVKKDGKEIDAVAQVTKVGFLFVLNRETGEPLFPVEERAVPPSNLPGEEAWPTQPFPAVPLPYSKQAMTEDDLLNISQASRDTLLRKFTSMRYEGLYTPPDTRGTLMLPGSRGGSEWGGAAYDPASGILYVNANESPEIASIQRARPKVNQGNQSVYEIGKAFYTTYCATCHGADRQGMEPTNPSLVNISERLNQDEILNKIKTGGGKMPAFASVTEGYEEEIVAYLLELGKDKLSTKAPGETDTTTQYLNLTAYGYFRDPNKYPAIKPPWGTLNAINLHTGDYEWRIPLGDVPEARKANDPPTGIENYGGPMVTAGGLVFIGATRDKKFRAFDKTSGDLVWETDLPGSGHATPSTYSIGNRQYIAIAVTGDSSEPGGYIVAFALEE